MARSINSCGADVMACGECCADAVAASRSTKKNGKPKIMVLDFPLFTFPILSLF
jgi:hypothetical protein